MPVVSYTAKRSLTGGVSAEDTVVLDLLLRDNLTKGRGPVRTESAAIDGTRESIYDRDDTTWQGTTQAIFTTDSLEMVMFLDSVESGETFQFAPYNSSGDSPIDFRNVVMTPGGYSENREISTGTPANDGFSYGFQVVEVP